MPPSARRVAAARMPEITARLRADQIVARKLVAARVRPDPVRLADITLSLRDCVI